MNREDTLRNLIKKVTVDIGIKQKKVAEVVGVSEYTFCKWLNHKQNYGKANLEKVEKYILDFFKVENYWEVQI